MELDIVTIVTGIFTAIGMATTAFRIIAPLTESKKDDKLLQALEFVLRRAAFNKDDGTIRVKVGK